METEAPNIIADSQADSSSHARSFTVRVPASTANLGAGFDCFGLALKLYLTVTANILSEPSHTPSVITSCEGVEAAIFPRTEDNLILRAMRLVADGEGLSLPPVQLDVKNELPVARGLGSSAAAIIAGITLGSAVCNHELSAERALRYALEMEGHPDNVAASYYGGWVITCVKPDGNVLTVKRSWPSDLKVIVVSPDAFLKTSETRGLLPEKVKRDDAVFNLQRVALFGAALEAGAYHLLWEASQDRLHQAHRQSLVPGLADALATPRQPGLVSIALSGSGPSVVALANDRFAAIGESIADNFSRRGVPATVRLLEVDSKGRQVTGTKG